MNRFEEAIASALEKAVGRKVDFSSVEIPGDPSFGDYAFPCFILAKELKKSPLQIASELSAKINSQKNLLIERAEQKGPYLNFFVNKTELIADVVQEILSKGKNYADGMKKDYTVLVESPSPNTNKPLHLGHVRNMVLGNTLVNLFRKLGYDAKRMDIVNDRGVHICKSMLAYEKFGKGSGPDKKPDHFVGDYYVIYSKEAEKNPALENDIHAMLEKWEANDQHVRQLWAKMREWCLMGFRETYDRFRVRMDKAYYESEVYTGGKDVVLDGLARGIFSKDEKENVVADLEEFGLGKKVLLRANGTAVYMTQDLYLATLRYKDYRMNRMIYVVGSEQKHHFTVLFKIFELLGYTFAKDCYHLAYGMVYLPEGKMKSREGTVVDADNLADDMHSLAREEIKSRYPELGKDVLETRAEEIGMGAIMFYILKYDPLKDFTYNPKESISFEGETGPYVQYTHARIASIMRKFSGSLENPNLTLLNTPEDFQIAKMLRDYPVVLEKAAETYKTSTLCRYLLDLSQLFNEYYHKHRILQEDKGLEKARMHLIMAIRVVLADGLSILSVTPIEEM